MPRGEPRFNYEVAHHQNEIILLLKLQGENLRLSLGAHETDRLIHDLSKHRAEIEPRPVAKNPKLDPDVGHVDGAVLSQVGAAPETWEVSLQYKDRSQQVCRMTIPFLDAMYMLNLLRGLQIDSGYALPEDPFLPSKPKPPPGYNPKK